MQASDFKTLVAECCGEVLDAMYFTTVLETSSHQGAQAIAAGDALAFTLRYEGDVQGIFGVSLDPAMARTLASNFLGEEEGALTLVEIAEVIGELTNMLCGSVVSQVKGSRKFALSHPEPLAADKRDWYGLGGNDVLFTALETDSGRLQTWITIDLPTPEPASSVSENLQETH